MADGAEEGVPSEEGAPGPGWQMGAEVHVKDKKLVEPERVWGKGTVVTAAGSKIDVKLSDGKGLVTVDLKKVKELYTCNPKTKCAACSGSARAPAPPALHSFSSASFCSATVCFPLPHSITLFRPAATTI